MVKYRLACWLMRGRVMKVPSDGVYILGVDGRFTWQVSTSSFHMKMTNRLPAMDGTDPFPFKASSGTYWGTIE